ncbi:MAG TPA: SCP2 sterol-binding domain-containing protein [Nocardioides sp.]|nr:SCP2 sterol-binding domain-containing protein [Nocardioides sp.]
MATASWAALGHASAEDVATFLRDAAPVALIEQIRAASDDEIVAATHDHRRGSSVVEGVMHRIGELAVPALLALMAGRVRWEAVDRPGEAVTLCFRDGVVEVEADPAGTPDVVVRGSDVQLLRLVAGQLDVAVAYLGDRIEISGASSVALAVASLFAADGTPPVTGEPVDVRAIDPVEVARALHGVPADHLRSVMASDFRPVILEEILERMPAFVNGRKAAGVQITVGFRLTGRPDGEVDRFVLRLRDGEASVLAGPAAQAVDRQDRHATVTCEAADFLRLVTGHLSAVSGVLRGQLRVHGDKVAALRLNAAFDIPTAVA